jgi:hypothetical protein
MAANRNRRPDHRFGRPFRIHVAFAPDPEALLCALRSIETRLGCAARRREPT